MKKANYERILSERPVYVPVFRIKRLPKWVEDSKRYAWDAVEKAYWELFDVGVEVYVWDWRGGVSLWERDRGRRTGCVDIRASYLEFVEYRLVEK